MIQIQCRSMYFRIEIYILPSNKIVGNTISANIHCSKQVIFTLKQNDDRVGSRTGLLLLSLKTPPTIIQIHRITKCRLFLCYFIL